MCDVVDSNTALFQPGLQYCCMCCNDMVDLGKLAIQV